MTENYLLYRYYEDCERFPLQSNPFEKALREKFPLQICVTGTSSVTVNCVVS